MAQRAPLPTTEDLDDLDDLDDQRYAGRLTHEQAVALFGETVQRLLGISTEEFLRRWDAGDYYGMEEDALGRKVNELVMFMGVVRPDVHGKPRPRPRG
jgi:hypothetical protein